MNNPKRFFKEGYQLHMWEPNYVWKCPHIKCGDPMNIFQAAAHYVHMIHLPVRFLIFAPNAYPKEEDQLPYP